MTLWREINIYVLMEAKKIDSCIYTKVFNLM